MIINDFSIPYNKYLIIVLERKFIKWERNKNRKSVRRRKNTRIEHKIPIRVKILV